MGYIVSFVSFHEHGFGVPASSFMRGLPQYYRVELHNLNPNSIAKVVIFTVVYEGYLGIDPHWHLWLHLFPCEVVFSVDRGEEGPHCGEGRWFYATAAFGSGATVYPCLPHLFEHKGS